MVGKDKRRTRGERDASSWIVSPSGGRMTHGPGRRLHEENERSSRPRQTKAKCQVFDGNFDS
ncbi:hypothetical protein BD626DRAFT_521789 [Schizophyllum amplum]|uniref:Uncharacterized protein n=1 Tax=Schizophyllum amplum TaxID=97359 RepID=A0A550BTK5_9AGAR|nr:hypothetical protein BD626DRAFT_521789 [Auriculariopsis ampla]